MHPTEPHPQGSQNHGDPDPRPPESALKAPPPDTEPPGPETPIWQGRTHWKHYMGTIVLAATLATAYAVIVGWIAARSEAVTATHAWYVAAIPIAAGIVYGSARLGWRILAWRYRVTGERLFIEFGVITQTIDQTELIRVDDVRVRKSIVDRLLGLGSVDVLSTDSTHRSITLVGIKDADGVAEIIRDRMRGLRRSSLFIENL